MTGIVDEGSLSVVVAISEFEDPELIKEPVLRVHGRTHGLEWSLPLANAALILTPEQQLQVHKMCYKLSINPFRWNTK